MGSVVVNCDFVNSYFNSRYTGNKLIFRNNPDEFLHLDIPVLKRVPPDEIYLVGGDFLSFCAVKSGKTPLIFEWRKDEKLLSSDTRYKIEVFEKHSVLSVPNISLNDAGVYSCFVKNDFGSDGYNIEVVVQGRIHSF